MTQITVLSLGGGLQSTVIAEMALDDEHELSPPDWIVHSDTGAESKMTKATVARIGKMAEEKGVNFKVISATDNPNQDVDVPIYQYYIDRQIVPLPRNAQCTMKFKIQPMNWFVKNLVDQSLAKPWIEMWIGITTDEAHRQREPPTKYLKYSYPLIEMGLSRNQCRSWMDVHRPDIAVAKSGCFHCHYQSAQKWAKLRREEPELFEIARQMEEGAKAAGMKNYGLWRGKSIAAFDHGGTTLEDFGFDMQPGDADCSAEGGCLSQGLI